MNHLSLEQGLKLKQWGFPQSSQEYYCAGKEPVVMSGLEISLFDEEPTVICACPDLEELLEWARKKSEFFTLRDGGNTWIMTDYEDIEMHEDPDPKVALIKLLEQVIGTGDSPKKETK